MAADTGVRMVVGGRELKRWLSYALENDMLAPSDAFSFRAANRGGELAGVIQPGARVEIEIDSETEMVGYVDEVTYGGAAGNEPAWVEVTGRDLGAFAVDCSAPAVSLHNLDLKQLASKLFAPWVKSWEVQGKAVKLARLRKTKIEPGDSPAEVLDRYCKAAKLTWWIRPDGTGVIGKPNYAGLPTFAAYRYLSTSPQRARTNVLGARVQESWREQFSSVTVGGSTSNTDSLFGFGATKFKAQAVDPEVPVSRPKNVNSGVVAGTAQARTFAEEAVQRGQFESVLAEYTFKGFYQGDERWRVDTLCEVVDEYAALETVLYVCRRRFYDDGAGRLTDVGLRRAGKWLA